MAYSEVLAERMRDALAGRAAIEERRMFGGLCFLMHGNMLCCVSGSGGDRFMFRVGKDAEAKALIRPGAMPVIMSGRRIGGFIRLDADTADDTGLADWIALAARFVSTLPAKVKP